MSDDDADYDARKESLLLLLHLPLDNEDNARLTLKTALDWLPMICKGRRNHSNPDIPNGGAGSV